jgi:DNA-binding HxlR family transcriptional regulator
MAASPDRWPAPRAMVLAGCVARDKNNVTYQQRFDEAVTILRGRWMIAILSELALGEVQYKDLRAMVNETELRPDVGDGVNALSDQTLTQNLKRAADNGLVTRRVETGQVKRTYYRLTHKGRTALLATRSLIEWAEAHAADDNDEESA